MTADDSLPTLRLATFCKMILGGPQGDVSLVGLLPGLNVNIKLDPGTELPDKVDLAIQEFALFAMLDPPKKRAPVTVETTVSSPDLINIKLEPVTMQIDFTQVDTANVMVRLDNFVVRSIKTEEALYTITAKWKVNDKTVGRLDLPMKVVVFKPS